MSFTVHVTVVTDPKLFAPTVRKYFKDRYSGKFKRTKDGDFYRWSMRHRAICDPKIQHVFGFARDTDLAVVCLSSPEINNDIEVF